MTRAWLYLAASLCCVLAWLASGSSASASSTGLATAHTEGITGDPPLTVRVVDPSGAPVPGALVYLGGCASSPDACQPRLTDEQGLVRLSPSDVLTQPVALALQEERSAGQEALCCQSGRPLLCRTSQGSWSYRVYLTNLVWSGQGDARPMARQQDGVVELRLQQLHPLILFDLLVSLDWQASDDYLRTLKNALRSASDSLLDLTDGQMAFGQLLVFDNRQRWDEAAIRVQRENTVCPYAIIGVVTGKASQGHIDLSPYWDGNYVSGDWSESNGYRTIVHEFMHYALGLYDEYLDGAGTGEAFCPQPKEQLCKGSDAANASAMFHEECATELSAFGVDPLWSDACENTLQWRRTAQSAWQTIAANYADWRQKPPRWQIDTPILRQSVMAGPDPAAGQWPAALPRWPEVDTQNAGAGQDVTIRLAAPRCAGALATVTLYPDGAGPGKKLGKAPLDAEFTLLGARPGDVICAEVEQKYSTCATTYEIPEAVSSATPTVTLSAFACKGDFFDAPAVLLPRAQTGQLAQWYPQAPGQASYEPGRVNVAAIGTNGVSPLLSYNLADGVVGLADLLPELGLPRGRLNSVDQGQLLVVDPAQSTFAALAGRSLGDYALQTIEPGQAGELFSLDGRASLLIEADAARAEGSTAILLQPQQPPSLPLPEGVRAQGEITYVGNTGMSDRPEGHAVLSWNCLPRPASAAPPVNYALLRLDDHTQQWQKQAATFIASANMLTAQIDQPGYYVFVEMEDGR